MMTSHCRRVGFLVLTSVWAVVTSSHSLAATGLPPREVANHIDQLLAKELFGTEDAAAPVDRIDDETFIRRASVDLVGELPTAEDVLTFVLTDDPFKRAKVINRLLADSAYGENWGRYWRDVILYRRSDDRALLGAQALTEFLTNKLNENASWSSIATAFITAKGDIREAGATALIMAQSGKPEESVAEISRVFAGIQIQCAQCHDHPTDRWKREQFHELAAFFPRVAIRPQRNGTQNTFLITATDRIPRFRRPNNNNRFIGTLEHRMPNLDDPSAKGELMRPVFFATGQKAEFGMTDENRRETLARWLTSRTNPWFAKAFVNRVWSELVGEGFYEPVDDLGPDRLSSAPETVKYLSGQFVESGYDVKWLYRVVMATDAYQREVRARRNYSDTPFLANCAQRLRSDQLYSNLANLLQLPVGNAGGGYRGARGARTVFSVAFGYDPNEPRGEVAGSIPQALALMNSPQLNMAISARRPFMLGRVLTENPKDGDAIVEVYLRALSRQPTDSEIDICGEYIKEVGSRNEAFEDILWALINSTEFRHRP